MITVETFFIDVSTGEAIGKADMPAERLPQSFALNTTMHIGEEDWTVLKAEPMTAEEFLQTGKLVLTLQKVVTRHPKDILLTLPTLYSEIPGIIGGSTKQGKNVLELHEDDWRQIEFVSMTYRSTVDEELAKVKRIYQEASVFNGQFFGFKELHLRQQLVRPLQAAIPLKQLPLFFTPIPYMYEGVSYQHIDGIIEGGFAFKAGTLIFYGQQSGGVVSSLGLKMEESVSQEIKTIASALQQLMATYNLDLVDWCGVRLISANIDLLTKFLNG